jgi:hypothetical protein
MSKFFLGFGSELVKLAQGYNPFGRQTAGSLNIPGAGSRKSLGIPGANPAGPARPRPAAGMAQPRPAAGMARPRPAGGGSPMSNPGSAANRVANSRRDLSRFQSQMNRDRAGASTMGRQKAPGAGQREMDVNRMGGASKPAGQSLGQPGGVQAKPQRPAPGSTGSAMNQAFSSGAVSVGGNRQPAAPANKPPPSVARSPVAKPAPVNRPAAGPTMGKANRPPPIGGGSKSPVPERFDVF